MPTSSPTDSKRITSGDEANALVRELAQQRLEGAPRAGDAVTFGVPYFDENIPPMIRGEITVLLGLTSHGKTLLAATVGNHTLKRLGNSGSRGLLVVMTEETVEARRVQMWGDSQVTIRDILTGNVKMERIDYNIHKTRGQPLYYIGQTTGLSDVGNTDAVMRPSTIADGVAQLQRLGVEPELLIIDHAHDLESDRPNKDEQSRCENVSDELKQLANALTAVCPLFILGQVKKELENRPPLDAQPNTYDIKYMQSLIARTSNVLTILYPQRHKANGLLFPTVRGEVKATKGVFLVHCAKARNGRCAGETIPMTALDDDGMWSNQLREMEIAQ